ncbi:MAG: 5'-nucleotidase C-terminal domain-containing protein [Chitinophagales bacterium]
MQVSFKNRHLLAVVSMMFFFLTFILTGVAQVNIARTEATPISNGVLSQKESDSLATSVNNDFNDINNSPSKAAIRGLKALGLVSGFSDGSFHPDAPVSQIEAISLFMRLADESAEQSSPSIKNYDIPSWGQTSVYKAISSGIISTRTFRAAAPATHVQVMVWLAKAVDLDEGTGSLPFKDGQSISPPDRGYIKAFYNLGIEKYGSTGKFEPNRVVTRAQLAAIIKTMLDKNLIKGCVTDNGKNLVSLDVYTINDFHGNLMGDAKNPGAAKLGKWLKDAKTNNPEGTIILSAGDMSQGSVDSNLLYGKTVIKVMNEIGFDAMAIGNHEFDWELNWLKNQDDWANFPILTANITDKASGRSLEGTQPWVMVEKKGIKIGIIGLTTTETLHMANPKFLSGCEFSDPAEAVNKLIPELKRQGAQVIIVLGHLGAYQEDDNDITGEAAELAKAITGADVLVSGHSHQKIAGYINEIPVVQGYYNSRAVGHVALKYSLQTNSVISAAPSVIDLTILNLNQDAGVKNVLNEGQSEIAPVKNEVIGKNLDDLVHQGDKVSILGQWETDIMRQEARADIAFQNGGGLRTSIMAGDITVGNIWHIIPFDNTLVLMNMKGSQIVKVLQHGINNPKYQCLQYSGIRVKYNSMLSPDKRVVEVIFPDGSILDPQKTYKVVTNDFMAAGGDDYTMFKEGTNVNDTHQLVRDLLIQAVKTTKVIDFKGDDRFQDVSNTVNTSQVKPAA